MNAFNTNPYLTGLISAGAPQSSAGGLGYIDGTPSIQTLVNDAASGNGLYQGDYMYLFLKAHLNILVLQCNILIL